MEVNFSYYISHYFQSPDYLYFFGLALAILFVLFVILYLYTVTKAGGLRGMERHEFIRIEWHILVERYYEMVFSGTSILLFMASYYLIDRFVTIEPLRSFWEKYDDYLLLILIIFSCMFNSFLDRVFVKLKFLNRDEKSAGRLSGMFYMIFIFIYIKFIYQDDNYDKLIGYFITLMVGRFAYFDASVHDFLKAMMGVFKNAGLMIFLLVYTSLMCLYGFKTDYLITHNGVITNIFFTHLFMCFAIFVLFHIHIAELVTGRGGRKPNLSSNNERRKVNKKLHELESDDDDEFIYAEADDEYYNGDEYEAEGTDYSDQYYEDDELQDEDIEYSGEEYPDIEYSNDNLEFIDIESFD